jgi:hypothetical protein
MKFVVRLEAKDDHAIRSLRALLKIALRRFGLRCLEAREQQEDEMDMRKYGSGFIKPDDVRDRPRQERIINIYESEKYGCPVFEFESGDQFSLNATNNRILCKAWGWNSEDWLGQEIELSLGHYKDWRADPPEEKETVIAKALSAKKPSAGNGDAKPLPAPMSRRGDMDDEIPF